MPEGFFGFLDFTGLPTGQELEEEVPPPVGFCGLLDYTGVPCGAPDPARKVGNAWGAGKKPNHVHIRAMAEAIHQRTLLDAQVRNQQQEVLAALTRRVLRQHLEFEEQLFKFKRNIVSAVLLSEL